MKFLFILFFAHVAFADNLLLLTSGRLQNLGNCWAHAGAFMAESVYETKMHRPLVTELGLDLQTLNTYQRLWQGYISKKKFLDGGYANVVGGFPAEYFMIMQKRGLLLRNELAPTPLAVPTPYPQAQPYSIFKLDAELSIDTNAVSTLEDRLITENLTPEEADQLIWQVLQTNQKPWMTSNITFEGQTIPREELFNKIIPKQLLPKVSGEPLLITLAAQSIYPDTPLGFVDQDYLKFFTVPTAADFMPLIKKSLDQGYPVTFETDEHAMTILGYVTYNGEIYYAVANSNSDISWLKDLTMYGKPLASSTMFYQVIKDDLKKMMIPTTWRNPYKAINVFKPKSF